MARSGYFVRLTKSTPFQQKSLQLFLVTEELEGRAASASGAGTSHRSARDGPALANSYRCHVTVGRVIVTRPPF